MRSSLSIWNLIDAMPPGLYEVDFCTDLDEVTFNRELVGGNYVAKLLPRTLDDIRALGCNDAADERRFQTVARVSEINRGLYRRFASPVVKVDDDRAFGEIPARDASEPRPLRRVLRS